MVKLVTVGGTLTTQAYDLLRKEIIRAAFLPGQKLHIGQLCKRYSMGLSPIREALNRLSRDGLVVQKDQQGFQVSPLSDAHLEELTKTRGWLNEIGLRESIRNGDTSWEEQVVLAHYRMSKTPRGTPADGNVNDEWEAAHRHFHASLIAACGSTWVIRYCDQLFDAADRYRHLSRIPAARNKGRSTTEHRSIMEATVARDADKAVRLLLQHFEHTAVLVRRHMATAQRRAG